jgi:hypothetical protein
MRKILIILALLALSIQTSYATVAAYCQEEQATASHVSHHEHEKPASITSASDSTGYDSDCGVCHLAHSPALHSTFTIPIATTIFHYEDARLEFLVDISPHRPEKPNWLALA